MKTFPLRAAASSAVLALLVAACGGGADLEAPEVEPGGDLAAVEQSLHADIPFTPIAVPSGTLVQHETRRLFTTSGSYHAFFGEHPPANLDFRKEWVFFYSAGTQSSGGYAAKVLRIVPSATTLHLVTSLESPGKDCVVTMALTTPQVMVRFPKPKARLYFAAFYRSDTTVDCDQTSSVFCGGIAALPCPGAGSCVDDPSDSCDPDNQGRDCGGVCECNAMAACVSGYAWDPSPEVCGCVAAGCLNKACEQGTRCVDDGSGARCVSDGTLECGPNTCSDGLVCCNASCGICTPPDGACIQIACN